MSTTDLTRRDFLRVAAASAVGGAALMTGCGWSRKKSVSFLNWSGYIAKDTLPRFERETGIVVNYDYYSREKEMLAKLSSPGSAYDLVVAPDHIIARLASRKLIDPIPHDRFPSLDQLARRFRDPAYDRGLTYSLPYLWGTTGIGVDTTDVRPSPTSWRALWDEKYTGLLSMLDNEREAIQCALLLLGLPVDAKEPAQLEKAADLLVKQRPLLKNYDSTSYADELAAGRLRLAQAWSGDVLLPASQGKAVDFIIPNEGSFIWMDGLCLVSRSRAREQAVRLAAYLLRHDVCAEVSAATRYPTPNEKAFSSLPPSLRDDARFLPPEAVSARLRFSAPLDDAAQDLWDRAWEKVRL